MLTSESNKDIFLFAQSSSAIILGGLLKHPNPLNTYLGLSGFPKSDLSFSYIVVPGATTRKFFIP